MNGIVHSLTVALLCVAAVVRAESQAPFQQSFDLSTFQSQYKEQNLARVDRVIQMINNKEIHYAKAMSLAQSIENAILLDLTIEVHGAKSRFSATDRARAAKKYLSAERYLALERACSGLLESANDEERILALFILTRSLGSSAGKRHMETVLKDGFAALETETGKPDSVEEFFAAAENLAYLGSWDGADVLESVLRTDSSPSFLKCRALNAFAYLGVPLTSFGIADQLLSQDTAVAYTAFKLAESSHTNHIVISAAITQLEMLRASHQSNHTLSDNQSALLLNISLILRRALREKSLSGDALLKAKEAAIYFIKVPDEELHRRVVFLFSEMASDSDLPLIDHMLESPSAHLREGAAMALIYFPHETIKERKDVLITLLDDTSPGVRFSALFVLRKLLREKARNFLPDAEFQIQKARVLEKLKTMDMEK